MPTVTKFPTANEIVTNSGWTNPNNAHADDGSYATSTVGTGVGVTTRKSRWYNYAFGIPSDATIDSVKAKIGYFVSTTGGTAILRVNARVNTTDLTALTDTSEPTSETEKTFDFTSQRSWVPADFDDGTFKVAIESDNNSSTVVNYNMDYAKVEVIYTEAASGVPRHAMFYSRQRAA